MIRRYPGLRCEKCGSDEFELDVSSDGKIWTVYLSCAKCPRIFDICHADTHNCVSPIADRSKEKENRAD